MRSGLIVTAVAMLLFWGVPDAAAQQWVTRTVCDSVLIQGVVYPRVSFEVQNWDPVWAVTLVVAIRLPSTGPEDTCRVVSAVGPEKWLTQVATMPLTGEVFVNWVRYADDAPLAPPGGSLGGFKLVLTPGYSCSFNFQFSGFYPEPLAFENDSFECDRPVPVIGRTWGALKALYR